MNIQWDVIDMVSFLLGAGFSFWGANLPLTKDLFDFDLGVVWPRESRWVQDLKKIYRIWRSNHHQDNNEKFIDYFLNAKSDWKRGFIDVGLSSTRSIKRLLVWYIARRLSEPFIWYETHLGRTRRHTVNIDGVKKDSIQLRDFWFLRTSDNEGIITLNYDLLVEYSFGNKGFNYGIPNERLTGRGEFPISQNVKPIRLEGSVPLAKLHGSLSWYNGERYPDSRGGLTGKVEIVPPTYEKKPSPFLKRAWDLAREILSDTNKILVFGFAFKPYDTLVLELLKAGHQVQDVLIVDPFPKKNEVQAIWPHATINTCNPPPEGNPVISEWLKNTR